MNKIRKKLKDIITRVNPYFSALIITSILAWGLHCYAQAMKIELPEIGKMKNLMQNSQRIEYTVQKGDSLNTLRDKFFSIEKEEFRGLDSKIFYYNQENIYGEKPWREGYKGLTADNLWTQIVRKENKLPLIDCLGSMYYVKEGKKIYVPIRETRQPTK